MCVCGGGGRGGVAGAVVSRVSFKNVCAPSEDSG